VQHPVLKRGDRGADEIPAGLPYLGGKAGVSLLLGGAHRLLFQETFTFGGSSWSMGLRLGGDIFQL
jgi:hypothetical protein